MLRARGGSIVSIPTASRPCAPTLTVSGADAFERGVDGSECDWGKVLEWEPPNRLVVTWQISGEWRYDPDPARASEIEVRFVSDGPEQTIVELEHRHLDRLVLGQAMHDAVSGAGGWKSVLERSRPRPPRRRRRSRPWERSSGG